MKEQVKISNVMETYMGRHELTQGKFADALNEHLANTNINRVSVSYWLNSKTVPSTDFLLVCAVVYRDWRRNWALDCLKVKLPEVFDSGVLTFKLPLAR